MGLPELARINAAIKGLDDMLEDTRRMCRRPDVKKRYDVQQILAEQEEKVEGMQAFLYSLKIRMCRP
jgi:hypothetical protein